MDGGGPSPSRGVSQSSGDNLAEQEATPNHTPGNNSSSNISIVSGGGGGGNTINGQDAEKNHIIEAKDGASTLQMTKALESTSSALEDDCALFVDWRLSPEQAAERTAGAAAAVTPHIGDDGGGGVLEYAEEHVSRMYTKEEFMVRRWGMSMEQVKRVKALLRLGVNEDDLIIADRLLKLGRMDNETPWTKEEQLLGYSASQRQRIKALHTLGLTEESFERCRALMLSSLGPSAFGTNADETAENAARAAEEEGWTPSDKTRGWHFHSMNGVNEMFFKMKHFNHVPSYHPSEP